MKKIFIIAVLPLLALTGCSKFLDRRNLDSPATDIFLSNSTEIDLALTGIYNSSYWTEGNIPIQARFDSYTDLGVERTASIASGSFDAANATIQSYYTYMYRTVSRANAMLAGMQKGKGNVAPAQFNRNEAEAKVLRAWAYFNLMSFWGDVVYYTQPGEPQDYYAKAKSPKANIIDSLILDLDDAAPKLDWLSYQRGRGNRGVALGIKAKLALLDKRYQVAADAAKTVIDGNAYNLNPNYVSLFTRAGQAANAGKEIMFEMVYPTTDPFPVSYISLGQYSRTLAAQSGRFPLQALVDKFETRDGLRIDQSPLYDPANPNKNRDPRLRETVNIHGDTIGATISGNYRRAIFNIYTASTLLSLNGGPWNNTANTDFTNPFGPVLNGVGLLWRKYSNDETDDMANAKTAFVYMRYAEILSIYAEAKIEMNQMDATVTDAINKVRRRAGMPDVTAAVAASQAKMRQLVRREKVVEFANEGLHLFDMRRWNTGALSMNTFVYGASKSPTVPAAIPSFGAAGSEQDLNDIPNYATSDAQRFKREQRTFAPEKHNLWPIPQREIDINNKITQNTNW